MQQDYICPNPRRWNEIFKDLCATYEIKTGMKLPSNVVGIRESGGPPTPLILNGWVFSNDNDKRLRWRETLRWAEKQSLLHLTKVEIEDRVYHAGHTRGGGILMKDEYSDFTLDIMKKYKLTEYVTLKQYKADPDGVKSKLPFVKGIYFVIYPHESPLGLFLKTGTGGFFNKKNPNVPLADLWDKWVDDADILYIGQTGGTSITGKASGSTLIERITDLIDFGNRKKAGHWGGRYLWQHENSENFKVYWYPCTTDNPEVLKNEVLAEFKQFYHKKPFANLR